MKTLYVVRHAKSSWDNPEIGDIERPLSERGRRDAPRMGKRLKEKSIHPDIMLTSHARRAAATCTLMAEAMGYPQEKIKTEEGLYHANEDELLEIVRKFNPKFDDVMIFGHNPGLTEFVNSIIDEPVGIDNIPTCGIIAISFAVDSWKEVNWGSGKFLFFDYPKSKND